MSLSTDTRSPQTHATVTSIADRAPAPQLATVTPITHRALAPRLATVTPITHRIRERDAARRLWRGATPGLTLSVVIPFYNPGAALRPTVVRLVEVLDQAGVTFEVIAVSDGSTDGSEADLDGLDPRVAVLVAPVNRGKGAALRLGMQHAAGSWVGFVDADGDIDPQHLNDYLHLAQVNNHEVVYADKRDARSGNPSTAVRRLISWTFSHLVSTLFSVGVGDTQTGCKLIRRDVLARVLPATCEEGFAFDLEFFVAARAAGVTDMVGAPVHLSDRLAGSTVTTAAIVRTLKDTIRVFTRLHFSDTYTPVAAQPLAPVTPLRGRTVGGTELGTPSLAA